VKRKSTLAERLFPNGVRCRYGIRDFSRDLMWFALGAGSGILVQYPQLLNMHP
jgi:hypothetical protein